MALFPSLAGFEPTRETLHSYAHAAGVIPRAHATPHPKWWHISLRVVPGGLVTMPMALPSGEQLKLKMDLQNHAIKLLTNSGGNRAFSMLDGATGTEMGDQIIAAVAELGLESDSYAREKFESDAARPYDPAEAAKFLTAVTEMNRIFRDHRATLTGNMGPIQLWPHGFDLAFEWFGTRVEQYEEHGELQSFPSQLNLGFYPGNPIYVYSNPWPFASDVLLGHTLPGGAEWHTDSFQGSMLFYDRLVGNENAEANLRAYMKTVFDLAAPTLMAE